MKKRDLEKQLSEYGWYLGRHGGKHDYWTNGEIFETVPRHKEVNEMLSKKILKTAKNNPPKK
jgi:mRNA interferase HicA